MAIRVVRGKVDTGDNVYVAGDVILGLSPEDEEDLVAKEVGELIVPMSDVVADHPNESGSKQEYFEDVETEDDPDESDGEREDDNDGPPTSLPGIAEATAEQPRRIRKSQ